MHNIKRLEETEKGFSQVRPRSGDGSPAWYAPQRDVLHNFSTWMRLSLTRFDNCSPEEQQKVMETVKSLAALTNALYEGKFAGKPEELEKMLEHMQKDMAGYEAVGAAFMTTMLWKFWQFAGEVSLRQEGPIKSTSADS